MTETKEIRRSSLQDRVIIAAVGFDNNAEAKQKLQAAFDKQAIEQGFVEAKDESGNIRNGQ